MPSGHHQRVCTGVRRSGSWACQVQPYDASSARNAHKVGGSWWSQISFCWSREGTGTYKQAQLGGGLGRGAGWKFLTTRTPWLAGLSSLPAETTAVVLQKYEKCRIRQEMTSVVGAGLHPPFSTGGDSCRANECNFPASRHGLDMISDLTGLLLFLTSVKFFICIFHLPIQYFNYLSIS